MLPPYVYRSALGWQEPGHDEHVARGSGVVAELNADAEELDAFVRGLDYTMLLVTTRHERARSGALVGFSTQTSIDPFRFLVCLSHKNLTTRVAEGATHLAVHQFGPDQLALARLFGEHSGDDVDKFARCAWTDGPEGVPILDGCPAWMVGEITARLDLGDHHGMLLAPVAAARARDSGAVTFSELPDLDPGHEA